MGASTPNNLNLDIKIKVDASHYSVLFHFKSRALFLYKPWLVLCLVVGVFSFPYAELQENIKL